MTREYTLKLTAAEAESLMLPLHPAVPSAVLCKLDALAKQARRDAEADDLRLPWRVTTQYGPRVINGREDVLACSTTTGVAKLMAAAPELLKAVRAAKRLRGYAPVTASDFRNRERDVDALIDRALRKVSTGVPE